MRMYKPAKYLHEGALCEYVGQDIHEIKFTLPYWMHFGISRSIFYFFFFIESPKDYRKIIPAH